MVSEDESSPINDRPRYGYRADEAAAFAIIPEEAVVVRRIYALYLCGMSILKIKAALEADGILSPAAKSRSQLIQALDDYIRWYNEKRIKLSLGGKSPSAYRACLGYTS